MKESMILGARFSRSALGREFGARLLRAANDQTIRDSGDVCGARNTQFEQEFLGLFLGETVSAYDWRDHIGDFCVADYLAELDKGARDEIFYTILRSLRPVSLDLWSCQAQLRK